MDRGQSEGRTQHKNQPCCIITEWLGPEIPFLEKVPREGVKRHTYLTKPIYAKLGGTGPTYVAWVAKIKVACLVDEGEEQIALGTCPFINKLAKAAIYTAIRNESGKQRQQL